MGHKLVEDIGKLVRRINSQVSTKTNEFRLYPEHPIEIPYFFSNFPHIKSSPRINGKETFTTKFVLEKAYGYDSLIVKFKTEITIVDFKDVKMYNYISITNDNPLKLNETCRLIVPGHIVVRNSNNESEIEIVKNSKWKYGLRCTSRPTSESWPKEMFYK
ncbi:MAG: hypothetical protein KAQ83_01230 [Nanoarchaeota archaeon]|nr:hypothetical protein [Nanoarchaeota archaeon]